MDSEYTRGDIVDVYLEEIRQAIYELQGNAIRYRPDEDFEWRYLVPNRNGWRWKHDIDRR